jgi:hypothetical protein
MDHLQVQIDEGFEFELHSGFGQRRFGYDPFGHVEATKGFKEIIEFVLIGASYKVDEKNDQYMKGKFSLAREIFFAVPVTVDKVG